ncbi:hypothetical protein MKZ38_007420 [Zalerion maritima]|uniref:Uncharacterized protein n=1 Tax=Zalerion maritima TaxID=339359 RepID=A0AAD5RUY1_9PEZI|nr:hypothetical protein MKZ38_007420 [Zalerion maritima]
MKLPPSWANTIGAPDDWLWTRVSPGVHTAVRHVGRAGHGEANGALGTDVDYSNANDFVFSMLALHSTLYSAQGIVGLYAPPSHGSMLSTAANTDTGRLKEQKSAQHSHREHGNIHQRINSVRFATVSEPIPDIRLLAFLKNNMGKFLRLGIFQYHHTQTKYPVDTKSHRKIQDSRIKNHRKKLALLTSAAFQPHEPRFTISPRSPRPA